MKSLSAPARGAWFSILASVLILLGIAGGNITPALGQQQPLQRLSTGQLGVLQEKLNESTLLLATGHPTASYFAMSHDIASAVNRDDSFRLLPLAGEGGLGPLRDLLLLRGVDLAIVPANVLVRARETQALGPSLAQRVAYITRLYNEDVHLIAGASINAFNELRGKKVAVPQNDGNAFFALRDLMEHVEIEAVRMHPAEGLSAVRSGEIAAVLLVGSKPMPLVSEIAKDGRLRLLNVPFVPALEEGYVPSAFRSDDYPSLVPPGVVVETLAVSAVLLASAKDRDGSLQRVSRAVPVLLGALSERPILNPHSGWGQLNIAATLQGWTRLAAADEWLRDTRQAQSQALQRTFEAFLRQRQSASELNPAERKQLFDEFVRWTRKSVGNEGKTQR